MIRADTKDVAALRRRSGWWYQPLTLNLLADALLMGSIAVLGYALLNWWVSRPLFPMKELVVKTPLANVTMAQLRKAAEVSVDDNFFRMDLNRVQSAFEAIPWVRRAEVRRLWPDQVELRLEEHRGAAYWNRREGTFRTQLLNWNGEVFDAESHEKLPLLSGPAGSGAFVLAQYQRFAAALKPLHKTLPRLTLSDRYAWRLELNDGMQLLLGRENEKTPPLRRLEQFVSVWPRVQAQFGLQTTWIDLRYNEGFALRPQLPASQDENG